MIFPEWTKAQMPFTKIDFGFDVEVQMLREDFRHPFISGNKWWKLKYFLQDAIAKNQNTIASCGGAFSNHLLALAAAGNEMNFKTIGFVRGEELNNNSNSLLQQLTALGMDLHFVSRKDFEELYTKNQQLKDAEFYFIPMGGEGMLGEQGAAEMIQPYINDFDFVVVCAGTGTTAKGFSKAISIKNCRMKKVICISAVKEDQLNISTSEKLEINFDYHFGGLAKSNSTLYDFTIDFQNTNQIAIDKTYNAKMLFGLQQLIAEGKIKSGSRVLAVHTGGVHRI